MADGSAPANSRFILNLSPDDRQELSDLRDRMSVGLKQRLSMAQSIRLAICRQLRLLQHTDDGYTQIFVVRGRDTASRRID